MYGVQYVGVGFEISSARQNDDQRESTGSALDEAGRFSVSRNTRLPDQR
jgi:hypothetical protein